MEGNWEASERSTWERSKNLEGKPREKTITGSPGQSEAQRRDVRYSRARWLIGWGCPRVRGWEVQWAGQRLDPPLHPRKKAQRSGEPTTCLAGSLENSGPRLDSDATIHHDGGRPWREAPPGKRGEGEGRQRGLAPPTFLMPVRV